MPAIFCVRFSAMAGMDLGNEKQMSMNVDTKVILRFSDLASAEKSVKKRTQFFPHRKTDTHSSKFVFYGRIHHQLPLNCRLLLILSSSLPKNSINLVPQDDWNRGSKKI